MNRHPSFRNPVAAVATTSMLLCMATAPSTLLASESGVMLTGYNVQYGGSAVVSDTALSRAQLCGADGPASMLSLMNQVADRLEERLAGGGISPSDRQRAIDAAVDELCQGDESFNVDAYAMTYAECRMTMDTASILTDIHLPPDEASASMTMSDFYSEESTRVSLDRNLNAATGVAVWAGNLNWTGPGESKEIAGYPTTRWDFQYETGMDLGGGGESGGALAALGLNATISTTGHGYYSTTVPGMNIVNAFFDRFTSQVQASEGGSSMFEGMLNTMVEMIRKGMPLEMDQTITSNMMGGGRGGMRSVIKASGVQTVSLIDDFCTRSLVPDHFTVTDMSGQLEASSAELNQSMGELNKAMEGMTPEQREAMKGLGLGSLFGRDAAAKPASQPAQAPAGTAATSSRSMPSSADLTTNNMTQSVQKHLQALGYDVGNTNGNVDTTTVIAISQFQAEKGLEVTGKVTPQLLGILGAEVDSR